MMTIKIFREKHDMNQIIDKIKPWLIIYLDRILYNKFGDCLKYININDVIEDFIENDESIIKKSYDCYKFIYKHNEFSDFLFDTQFKMLDVPPPSDCVSDYDNLFDDDCVILKSITNINDFFEEEELENDKLKYLEKEVELFTIDFYYEIFISTYAMIKNL